ncbi:hypothetical protein Scep_021808 [Stephania cephalantha]|uniref:Pyrrolo-quinoline quinone repeat domain-containing protein n=1 Tax=Stephania cephalantha TaxID=152367 RepID=A0AAP0FEV9_9MAGN
MGKESTPDGKRVYTNIANSNGISFKFTPSNINTTAGAWVAMDAVTGKILWSIANPRDFPSNAPANGVLFSGSPDPQGALFAMDASSGRILWSYNTNAPFMVVRQSVTVAFIWEMGTRLIWGRASVPIVTAGTSLFAFSALAGPQLHRAVRIHPEAAAPRRLRNCSAPSHPPLHIVAYQIRSTAATAAHPHQIRHWTPYPIRSLMFACPCNMTPLLVRPDNTVSTLPD